MRARRTAAVASLGVLAGAAIGATLLVEETADPSGSQATAATVSSRAGSPNGLKTGVDRTTRAVGDAAGAPKTIFGVTPAPRRQVVRPRPGNVPASGLLVDATTGAVLWSRNKWQRRSIASLTKMMNALVALDRSSPDRRLRVSWSAASIGGSAVGGLPAGGRMRVGDLLRGMMLPSGNDAANVLAEGLGPGRGRYVARMNARARRMGLRCTRFVSPEGLGEGNRSCARDLAVIAKAILANRKLAMLVRREWDSIDRGSNGRKLVRNRNPLVQRHYRGITGIKTGHTAAAGWCLVASATRGRHRLIAVMLGEDERAWMAQRMLDAGFRALSR